MLNINDLSTDYQVKRLTPRDVDHALHLVQGNSSFFSYCPPAPTRHSVLEDMKVVPTNKTADDKYYLGYYADDELVAIIDFIVGYPAEKDVWIGFFMVDAKLQRQGIGSKIMDELSAELNKIGSNRIEVAYPKGNDQSKQFLLKNGFVAMEREVSVPGYTMVIMEKSFS